MLRFNDAFFVLTACFLVHSPFAPQTLMRERRYPEAEALQESVYRYSVAAFGPEDANTFDALGRSVTPDLKEVTYLYKPLNFTSPLFQSVNAEMDSAEIQGSRSRGGQARFRSGDTSQTQ